MKVTLHTRRRTEASIESCTKPLVVSASTTFGALVQMIDEAVVDQTLFAVRSASDGHVVFFDPQQLQTITLREDK